MSGDKANWEYIGCFNSIGIFVIFLIIVFPYLITTVSGVSAMFGSDYSNVPNGILVGFPAVVSFIIFFDYYLLTVAQYRGNIAYEGKRRRKLYHRVAIFNCLALLLLGYLGSETELKDPFDDESIWIAILFGTSFLLTFLIPVLAKIVKSIFEKKRYSSNDSWLLDKIIAPVVVGSILGVISYLVTGEWNFGSSPSLYSISISVIGFIGTIILGID